MARATTTILVIVVLMNGAAGIMVESGVSGDLGVQMNPGGQDEVDNANETAQENFEPGGGLSTLINLFVSVGQTFATIISSIFVAPLMFMNLGFPSWIVVPIFAPMYIIATLEIVSIVSGRRTT